jgi:hypothetical protein
MKFARYWPLAAVVFGLGLIYVVFAQADPKTPPSQIPQPVDAVFESAEAPWSPSDLPTLGIVTGACQEKNACSSGQCKLTAKVSPVSTEACSSECASACKGECTTACESECEVSACDVKCAEVAAGDCATACSKACDSGCQTQTTFVATADCACGTNCACAKECACGDKCKCGEDKNTWKTRIVEACGCGDACACSGEACANSGADCPFLAGRHPDAAPAWLPRPPHFFVAAPFVNPGCSDRMLPPSPGVHVWGPTPTPPVAYPAPIPAPFAPPAPEMHHAMHEELVHAMTQSARLQARDEAWTELQNRDRALAELAVQNARLQAQVELASQKEEIFQQTAELLVKNAALEAKLEAAQEREGMMEAFMEVATEKAKLEAATELLEVQHEIHAEALGAMVETRQELLGPLHEALVENASLKAHAASKEEATTLKARIAELEKAVAKAEKQASKLGVPVKTAKKAESESETK